MMNINNALAHSEKALEEELTKKVSMATLRAIFNNALLNVASDMQEASVHRVDNFSISAAAAFYLEDMNVELEGVIFDGESLEDDDQYEYFRSRSNTFFYEYERLTNDHEYCVENHIAKLAMKIPKLGKDSSRMNDFTDEILLSLFAKAMLKTNSWEVYSDAKVNEIRKFVSDC